MTTTPPPDDPLLAEQAAYYRARADEYDQWWQRRGRYDRGPDATARWQAEVAEVEAWLADAAPGGDVLELAAGTGWWTERLARSARQLTCIDASPETLAHNRARLAAAGLPEPAYRIGDLFAWQPAGETFDVVFFSFWLSHVPRTRFAAFWNTVRAALRPGGRALLVDSLPDPSSTARDHRLPGDDGMQERRLDDGRTFRVVKLFHAPEALHAELGALGWQAAMRRTERYFVFGEAVPRAPSPAA